MKLRNKQTGKVQTLDFAVISDDSARDGELASLNSHIFIFRSIKQLNEEYEDYEPAEPLIKDEKIRKAVRAWAEACGVDDADIVRHYGTRGWLGLRYKNPNTGWVCKFEIEGFGSGNKLDNEKTYTIAELCGEEEE